MKSFFLPLAAILLSIIFSLTPLYGIGYLIIICVGVVYFPNLYVFRTVFSKFILAILLLLAIIPIIGLLTWLLGIKDYAVLNTIGYISILVVLKSSTRNYKKVPAKLIDRVDIVSLGIALLPILIMILSFFGGTPNKPAALFQLASEGWDNGAHIVMLEDTSTLNSYHYKATKGLNGTYENGTPYPQAWHLATSNFINGFGSIQFKSSQPMHTLLVYMIASISWLVIASYLLVLISWRIYESITNRKTKKISPFAALVSASLLTILVVLVASLMHGFTNYIGSIVYLLLLSALTYEILKKPTSTLYILAILFGTMSIITWFLTAPAVLLIILFMLLVREPDLVKCVKLLLKDYRVLIIGLLGSLAALLQIAIFYKYSANSGTDQLTVGSEVVPFDVTGSPLHISHVLFGFLMTIVLIYFVNKKADEGIKKMINITVLPWLLLTLGVYIFQNITAGYNSYYLTKVVGLCFTAASIPLIVIFLSFISKVKLSYDTITKPLLSICIVILAVLACGQPTYGLNKLFQRNARTTYGTAEQVVKYLPKTTTGNSYIVILTDRRSYENSREDNHGKLEQFVVNQPLNCTSSITGYNDTDEKLSNLRECANSPSMKDKTLFVITTGEIRPLIQKLDLPNVIAIKS